MQKFIFLGITWLFIFSSTTKAQSSLESSVEQVQEIFRPGESLQLNLTITEFNTWLKSKKQWAEIGEVKFQVAFNPNKATEVSIRSDKRLPLDVESELTEYILNLEEVFFLKQRLQNLLSGNKGKLSLVDQQLVQKEGSKIATYQFDQDLRSGDKKFLKHISIEQGQDLKLDFSLESELVSGVLLPAKIKLERFIRKPITGTKDHSYSRRDTLTFLITEQEFKKL